MKEKIKAKPVKTTMTMLALALQCLAWTAGSASAQEGAPSAELVSEDAAEIYASNRGQLLASSGCKELEGFVFSTAFVKRANRGGDEREYSRAMVVACGKYVGYLIEMDEASDLVPSGFHDRLREQARLVLVEQEVDLTGLQHVGKGFSDDDSLVFAVVAVESAVLKAQTVTWESFMAKFQALVLAGAAEADPTLFLEVCRPGETSLVWDKAVDWMCRRNGEGLRTTLRSTKLNGLGEGWLQGGYRIGEDALQGVDGPQLLKLLAARPGDVDVIQALIDRQQALGFVRNADRFSALLPGADRLELRDDDFERALAKELAMIQRAPLEQEAAEAFQLGERAKLVIAARGSFQLVDREVGEGRSAQEKGTKLFFSSPPDVEGAMQAFFASLEKGVSADTSSYLSAALISSGHHATAFCFARQAWEVQPYHLYAGVNALRSLRALNRPKETKVFMEQFLAERPNLDQWGNAQLEDLQLWLKTQEGV